MKKNVFKEIMFEATKTAISKMWIPDNINLYCDNENKVLLISEKSESGIKKCECDFTKENFYSEGGLLSLYICKKCGVVKK